MIPPARELSPNTFRRLLPWFLIALILLGEFVLFRSYAVREVAWSYPKVCDQAVYLEHSYETYDRMRRDGLKEGLRYGAGFNAGNPPSPNGALIHLQAALLFFPLGPGRVSALTLNFLYFALFQIILVATLKSLSGRWMPALLGLGLLLAARTTFQETGGIMDFRLDFITFCLFGIFIALVIRSEMFAKTGWSVAAGLVASYTVAFRFITIAYFAPIVAITFFALAIGWSWSRGNDERRIGSALRLRNLTLAAALSLVAVAPVLLHHQAAIRVYYFGHHANAAESSVRARMFGVTGWRAALAFYPQSVELHHGGLLFVGLILVVMVAGLVMKRTSAAIPLRAKGAPGRAAVGFALVALLVPLSILTLDADKNAAVGGILIAPIIWLVLLLAAVGVNAAGRAVRCGLTGFVLTVGLVTQIVSYTRHSTSTRHRSEVISILAMYQHIEDVSRKNGWTSPVIADDVITDYLFVPAINVVTYERDGYLLHAQEGLANTLLARSPDEIMQSLESAQFVVPTSRLIATTLEDPLERATQSSHAQIMAYCENKCAKLYEFRTTQRQVILFGRKP